jgi:hypothetical protein
VPDCSGVQVIATVFFGKPKELTSQSGERLVMAGHDDIFRLASPSESIAASIMTVLAGSGIGWLVWSVGESSPAFGRLTRRR